MKGYLGLSVAVLAVFVVIVAVAFVMQLSRGRQKTVALGEKFTLAEGQSARFGSLTLLAESIAEQEEEHEVGKKWISVAEVRAEERGQSQTFLFGADGIWERPFHGYEIQVENIGDDSVSLIVSMPFTEGLPFKD
ncbi:MAG: hypothetical protein AAB967_00350 [Patescibacteria group bacterium]